MGVDALGAQVGDRLRTTLGVACAEPDRVLQPSELPRDLAADSLVRARDQRRLAIAHVVLSSARDHKRGAPDALAGCCLGLA